jgi:hypothetical protein
MYQEDEPHHRIQIEDRIDSFPTSDVDSESYQNGNYAYKVTLVDNKPQFTPASTFGPDDEFWMVKPTNAKVEITQMSDNDNSHAKQPRTTGNTWSWIWQVSSLLISMAGLMAIVVVLVSIVRHPRLADWTVSPSSKISPVISSNVSPNTLIAIFAAISKAALLVAVADCIGQLKWIRFEEKPHLLRELEVYDEASRGPWGSLKLLFTTRHTALLAALGAFIMVVSIAIDPFAQQIISNVTQTVVAQNESASYQIAHTYDTSLQSVNAATSGKHHLIYLDIRTFNCC